MRTIFEGETVSYKGFNKYEASKAIIDKLDGIEERLNEAIKRYSRFTAMLKPKEGEKNDK